MVSGIIAKVPANKTLINVTDLCRLLSGTRSESICIDVKNAYAYLTLGHVEMPYFVSFSFDISSGSPGKRYMVGTLATEQSWTKYNAIRQCPSSINWNMALIYLPLFVPR